MSKITLAGNRKNRKENIWMASECASESSVVYLMFGLQHHGTMGNWISTLAWLFSSEPNTRTLVAPYLPLLGSPWPTEVVSGKMACFCAFFVTAQVSHQWPPMTCAVPPRGCKGGQERNQRWSNRNVAREPCALPPIAPATRPKRKQNSQWRYLRKFWQGEAVGQKVCGLSQIMNVQERRQANSSTDKDQPQQSAPHYRTHTPRA